MPINFECTECRSEVSVSGYDKKDDVIIFINCFNCLANVKIVKEEGEVKKIEIKGKKVYDGFTQGFNKYQPDDFNKG